MSRRARGGAAELHRRTMGSKARPRQYSRETAKRICVETQKPVAIAQPTPARALSKNTANWLAENEKQNARKAPRLPVWMTDRTGQPRRPSKSWPAPPAEPMTENEKANRDGLEYVPPASWREINPYRAGQDLDADTRLTADLCALGEWTEREITKRVRSGAVGGHKATALEADVLCHTNR